MFHSKSRLAFLILAAAVLFLAGVASTQAAAELPPGCNQILGGGREGQ